MAGRRVLRLFEKPQAGFWERYIERRKYPKAIVHRKLRGTVYLGKDSYIPSEFPAWSTEALMFQKDHAKLPKEDRYNVMDLKPYKKWPIFAGDVVRILKGKDEGLLGNVLYTVPERNWVFVDGLNCKHTYNKKGGQIWTQEMPLMLPQEVQLADPMDDKPTEVSWRFDDDGEEVRVSNRSSRIIPLPVMAKELPEGILASEYAPDLEVDTVEAQVTEVTFKPYYGTFEENILKTMGIKEDRKRIEKYWY